MGILDRFRSWLDAWPAEMGDPAMVVPMGYDAPPLAWFTPNVTYLPGGYPADQWDPAHLLDASKMSAAQMWKTQPHLRTIVTFLARNTAQLGLHTFERVDELDRRRDRTSTMAQVLRRPNSYMTTFDLIFALVGDLMLYDAAYWFVQRTFEGAFELHRIPPAWVTVEKSSIFTAGRYRVAGGGDPVMIPASEVLAFTGYSPTDPTSGSPTIDALRDILQEQIESNRYRQQVWKHGGRVSAVIQVPAGVKPMSDAAMSQFREDWYAQYTGDGPRAGGTPILRDGMTLNRVDFSGRDQQWAEGARLALTNVAAAFHVQPAMVGQTDGVSYANVREFRRMLYGETLGPTLRRIEDRLNTFLAPMLGVPDGVYAEFNVAEKLRGSFEEQAAVLQTSTGGPWMTRNEARARQNLPQIEGGDELIVPLNVVEGGQASPTDVQGQEAAPKTRIVRVKAAATDEQRDGLVAVFAEHFGRQAEEVLAALGVENEWWDAERWNRELADALLEAAVVLSTLVGRRALDELGIDPGTYDVDRTVAWLTAVAERVAASVNETTRAKVAERIGEDAEDPASVFDVAISQRAVAAGGALSTLVAGFATVEAAKHAGVGWKTWHTGPRSRDTHARMNGETVPVGEPFSNGMDFPGDTTNLDEKAGCNCSLSISTTSR